MFEFLNTQGLREWIPRMIREAQKEMVIVVPYIKTSENMYQALLEADKRGVESLIVYREESLKPQEKEKLLAISNLNLLHHPNVHAKCYMNESHLLITSMNLYEYSELNNREMGILITKWHYSHHENNPVDAAIREIRSIINSSQLEKKSQETEKEGFEIDIIKDRRGRAEDYCRKLSKIFLYKHFEASEENGGSFTHLCRDYADKIDVTYTHRVEFIFKMPKQKVRQIYYGIPRGEFDYEGFKFYWNSYNSSPFLYANSKHPMWNNLTDDEEIKLTQQGMDMVIAAIRKVY